KSVLEKWDGQLIEFNGEADHVHLLISYPPHKLLSNLVANLKSTTSKTLWREYEDYLSKTYWKSAPPAPRSPRRKDGASNRVFWTGSYFVASCGGVTIEQLKKYVQDQDSPT
ncbi:MAG: IS200/IS605 family transposase, partial [Prochloraceae cyanobacterium]